MDPLLHLYTQAHWHDAGHVVGDRAGLTALRDAIDRALTNKAAAAHVSAADGEGYAVVVILLASKNMAGLVEPYVDQVEGPGTYPSDLLPPKRYRTLLRPEDA